MKKVAIVLFVLEAIAIFGGIINGSLASMGSIFELIGFFIPAIIGVVLLIVAKKKEKAE